MSIENDIGRHIEILDEELADETLPESVEMLNLNQRFMNMLQNKIIEQAEEIKQLKMPYNE